ncbi:6-bladed beta-propeller, partial [candidate division KSB1 bacterium]
QRIELKFIRQIGELEGNNSNLQFYSPKDIAVDKSGNIYVLDGGNFRVQKLDPKGNFLMSFGSRGEGPGEFFYPLGIDVTEEGNIRVDDNNRAIEEFDQNGKYIKQIKFGGGKSFRKLNNGFFATDLLNIPSGDNRVYIRYTEYLADVYDESANLVLSLGKRQNYDDPNMAVFAGDKYEIETDYNGNYYLAFLAQNRIDKYSPDGKYLFRASRELGFEESKEVKMLKAGRSSIAPYFNRFSNRINIDNKNRLWVETYRRTITEDERVSPGSNDTSDILSLEIYDENGILLQRLPWKYGKSRYIKRILNDRVFVIDKTDMCIYEYQILDKN